MSPTLIAAALLIAAQASSPPTRTAGSYVVTLDSLGAHAMHVRAEILMTDDRLWLDSIQADHLERGWATFIQNLVVRDEGGTVRRVEVDGPGRWRVPGLEGGRATLSYDVDLGFAREPWPVGNEQAGQVFEESLYLVARPLFIVSGAPGSYRVRFELPASFIVSTPWERIGGQRASFAAADATVLMRNPLVIGRHPELRLSRSGFDFILALPGSAGSDDLVREPLEPVLERYLALFPTAAGARYLMVQFQSSADDGEGFHDGSAFTVTDELADHNRPVWANFLAHELLHYWNGTRLRGRGPRSSWQWFSEGVTEYIANLTLLRTGVFDDSDFLEKVERHLGNYLYFKSSPAFPAMSLEEAGTRKGTYRFGVYDGGWTAAFCLDTQMRAATWGRVGVDDLLALLVARAEPYDLETITRATTQLAGVDVTDFLNRYVAGRETIPVEDCVRAAGYEGGYKSYAGEVYLDAVTTPSDLQRAIWQGMRL